ncbi:hypothetical protein TMatcc_006075 [Talaromyces marneffei ATCC 18224]
MASTPGLQKTLVSLRRQLLYEADFDPVSTPGKASDCVVPPAHRLFRLAKASRKRRFRLREHHMT